MIHWHAITEQFKCTFMYNLLIYLIFLWHLGVWKGWVALSLFLLLGSLFIWVLIFPLLWRTVWMCIIYSYMQWWNLKVIFHVQIYSTAHSVNINRTLVEKNKPRWSVSSTQSRCGYALKWQEQDPRTLHSQQDHTPHTRQGLARTTYLTQEQTAQTRQKSICNLALIGCFILYWYPYQLCHKQQDSVSKVESVIRLT